MKRNFTRALVLILAVLAVSALISGCNSESIKLMFDNYQKAGGRLNEIHTAAILGFLGKNPGNGEEITDLIADRIDRMGYIQVMNPRETKRILKEQGLPTEGIVSTDDAREICKVLKVDALIFGTADAKFSSRINYHTTNTYPTYYYRNGRRYRRYHAPVYQDPYLNRSGSVTLNIHFYDARINKDLGSIELKKSYNKNYETFYSNRVRLVSYYYFDRLQRNPMPTDMDMIMLMTDRLMDLFVDGFTPYYVDSIRKLAPSVPGYDLAKDGKWDEAKAKWEKSLSGTKLDGNVYQNLGIYYERKVNAARAQHYYKLAMEADPTNILVQEYAASAGRAKEAQLASEPVDISPEQVKFHVAEVKPDGTVYVNGGKEDGVSAGDRFTILRARTEFYKDLVTPRGTRFYKLGEFTVDKVFDGICKGHMTDVTPGMSPRFRDPAIILEKAPPPPPEPDKNTDQDTKNSPPDQNEPQDEDQESGSQPSTPATPLPPPQHGNGQNNSSAK